MADCVLLTWKAGVCTVVSCTGVAVRGKAIWTGSGRVGRCMHICRTDPSSSVSPGRCFLSQAGEGDCSECIDGDGVVLVLNVRLMSTWLWWRWGLVITGVEILSVPKS